MIEFELWMYPVLVAAAAMIASRVIFWRLDVSERRWRREHPDRVPAE